MLCVTMSRAVTTCKLDDCAGLCNSTNSVSHGMERLFHNTQKEAFTHTLVVDSDMLALECYYNVMLDGKISSSLV